MDPDTFWMLPLAEQEALLAGPAHSPPPGVEPNLDHPPNKNGVVIGLGSTCLILASFFVLARVSGVERSWRKIHVSDYIILVAYGLYLAFMIVMLCEVRVGFLVHQWNIRLRDLPHVFHLRFLAVNLFTTTIMLLKVAILLEWVRLFVPRGTRNPAFYWTSVALLGVNCLFSTASLVVVNLACVPYEKNWNMLAPGRCFDFRGIHVASAVVNFVIDVGILVLPQRVIWGLRMSVKKRLDVSVVFVVGLIACCAAALRIPASVRYFSSQDVTYDVCTIGIWVVLEATCGLIVFCAPALPKTLSKLGTLRMPHVKSWAKIASSKRSSIKMNGVWNFFVRANNSTKGDRPEQHQYIELGSQRESPPGSENNGNMLNRANLRATLVDIEAAYPENNRA